MRDLTVLVLHLLATVARLAGPGSARSVVAESLLIKQHRRLFSSNMPTKPGPKGPTPEIITAVVDMKRPVFTMIGGRPAFDPEGVLGTSS